MEGIIGQEPAIEALQASLASGRLHHAFIFHGPAGVGKFTTALKFAEVLLCHEPARELTGRLAACGACESCRLLARPAATTAGEPSKARGAKPAATASKPTAAERPKGKAASTKRSATTQTAAEGEREGSTPKADDLPVSPHPDLHIVVKELARFSDERTIRERKLMNIPVEVLEQRLLGPVYLGSKLGHGKVFIVDEAELIDPIGQNKLLKTLEEPPGQTFLILVTSNEDRLLPTIRSRCQRVGFRPLPAEATARWLEAQPTKLSDAQRRWLLEFSDGSLGRLRLALDYGLAAWPEMVLAPIEEMARGAYPASLGAKMAELINDLAERWVEAHANASKDAANRMAAGLMWSMVTQSARRRLNEAAGRTSPADPVAGDAMVRPWLGVIDAIAQTEVNVATNVNLGVCCDQAVSMMHRAFNSSH